MRSVSEDLARREILERMVVAFSLEGMEGIVSLDAKGVIEMWLYPFLDKIKKAMLLSDKKLDVNDIYQMTFTFEKLVCDEEEASKI